MVIVVYRQFPFTRAFFNTGVFPEASISYCFPPYAAQSSVISVSSIVLTDESPPPAPPRSTSVRMSINRKDSSREDSPASTPAVSWAPDHLMHGHLFVAGNSLIVMYMYVMNSHTNCLLGWLDQCKTRPPPLLAQLVGCT